MSSVPDDENDSASSKPLFKLPDPPEDLLTLSGDILAIFIYSFLDHGVNEFFDSVSTSSYNAMSPASSTLLPEVADSMNRVPVWFDAMGSAPFGIIPLSSALPVVHHFSYAPAISYPGVAFVLFSSIWMFTSIFTGAFNFSNTLGSPRRAIVITTFTWILACVQLIAIAWSSDILVGYMNAFHKIVGLTRADADYICGSLTVLLFWRFIVSSLMGSSDDSGGNKKK